MISLHNLARSQKLADARGRDGCAVLTFQVVGIYHHAMRVRPCLQIRHRAGCLRAETEIGTHMQMRRNMPPKRAIKEFLRRTGGEILRERQRHHSVDARLRQHLQTLVVRHKLAKTISVEHLVRIDVKRQSNRLPAVFGSRLLRAGKQEAMPAMHAIEDAERARGTLEQATVKRIVGLKYRSHEAPPSEKRSMP